VSIVMWVVIEIADDDRQSAGTTVWRNAAVSHHNRHMKLFLLLTIKLPQTSHYASSVSISSTHCRQTSVWSSRSSIFHSHFVQNSNISSRHICFVYLLPQITNLPIASLKLRSYGMLRLEIHYYYISVSNKSINSLSLRTISTTLCLMLSKTLQIS